ncbi:MAG TPA: hypothetical protein VG455_06175 [Acidimicrobiales bacterium]|nr:hypothetical protein [Acidimicrobiales bacterium]
MGLELGTGQGSQREIADKWGIDRSTVVHICKVAKQAVVSGLAGSRPGRPGKTPEQVALDRRWARTAAAPTSFLDERSYRLKSATTGPDA